MNKELKEWLPISHECGWKGEVNIAWAKSIFEARNPQEPFYHDEIIMHCGKCKATQGIRKSCIYGEYYCNEKTTIKSE